MKRKSLPRRDPQNPVIREYDHAVQRGQKSYHVIRHENGWMVKKMGESRGSVFDTQNRAVDVAKNIAKRDKTELFIHGRDGRIRERNSYVPPRG